MILVYTNCFCIFPWFEYILIVSCIFPFLSFSLLLSLWNILIFFCILALVFCLIFLNFHVLIQQLASQRKMLKSLRRGIKGPIMRCRKCQCEVFGYIREHAKTVEHIVSCLGIHYILPCFSFIYIFSFILFQAAFTFSNIGSVLRSYHGVMKTV